MIKISIYKRLFTVYTIIGKTFGQWISPLITGLLLIILRLTVFFGSIFDIFFIQKLEMEKLIIL